jgi:MFS family permease
VLLALWPPAPVALTVIGWGLSGLGMGLAYPTTSLLTLHLSPPERLGANSAALQVTEALSVAVALAAIGPVFAHVVDDSRPTAFLVALALPVALALLATVTAGRVRAADLAST